MTRKATLLVGSRVLSAIVQAILFVLVARDLGPARFGVLGVSLTVVTLAVLFASFGSAQVVLRDRAAGDREAVREALTLGLVTSLALFGASVLIGLVAVVMRSDQWLPAAALLLAALTLEKSADVRLSLLIAEGREFVPSTNIVLRRIVGLVAYLITVHALGVREDIAFGAAYLLGGLLAAFLAFRASREFTRAAASRSVLRRAARNSLPYLSNNLTAQARTLDVVVISWLCGATQAGLYAAAYRLASPFLIVASGLALALVPHAVAIGRGRAGQLASRVLMANLVVASAGAITCWAGAPILIWVLGEDFSAVRGSLMPLLAAGIVLIGSSMLLGSILQANGEARLVSRTGIGYLVALVAGLVGTLSEWRSATVAASVVASVYLAKNLHFWWACNRGSSQRGVTDRQQRRLVVLEMTNAPDGTTRYIDQVVSFADEEIEFRYFSPRRVFGQQLDVAHFHWPDVYVRSGSRLGAAVKSVVFVGVIAVLSLRRVAIVRTLHNVEPHEASTSVGRWAMRALDRRTTFWITINPVTELPGPGTYIPHGHYRDRFAAHTLPAPEQGRALYAGLIRPYKGVERLLEVASTVTRPDFSLRIVGKPTPQLRSVVESATAEHSWVSARLEFVPDSDLVAEVGRASLVCLPYEELHNSGMLIVALSLGRPVLVPRTETTQLLAKEVGDEWILRYDGQLTTTLLEEALEQAAVIVGREVPLLEERNWENVGRLYGEAFRQARNRADERRGK